MISLKKTLIFSIPLLTMLAGCTKLDGTLGNTLTLDQTNASLGANGPTLVLQGAYADIGTPFTAQDELFSLEENVTDESLVPTRGGDWDDNGVWRVLHNHTWNADHGQLLTTFNNLNKLNFDATNVLSFKPTAEVAAEARFLRALSLYYLLDLFGQYPIRNAGDNLLNPPSVKTGADAIDFIISELTTILPDLASTNTNAQATPNAAKFLLMKCYLNKGAFTTRATPTFADADMQQVITLGNSIINSGNYSFTPNYFDNFSVDNGTKSKEGIFVYANSSNVAANNSGVNGRWQMTLHYNSNAAYAPNAGWNGFSTISDFYSTFNVTGASSFSPADTVNDSRLGGRYYQGSTNKSGVRPGFLVGQQYNGDGSIVKDRNGTPLAFLPTIADNMIEQGAPFVEAAGIRVVKYVPDSSAWNGPAGNDLMLFRYSDVVLMVAEAQMREAAPDNASALALVNSLRTARGASTFASLPLVNASNVDDPNTLLAERGRELYWESFRRNDLIRFGVYLLPWGLKPSDDPKNLLFPIPNQSLAANPNLKQNTGY